MRLDQIHAAADANGLLVYCVVVPSRLTPKAWIHAHERGLLVRIHHGVSRPVDTPETPDLLIAAAIAAARPAAGTNRALASGRAGAFAVGVSVPPLEPVHVVVAGRTPHRPLAGVAIHRPRNHLDLIGHGPGDRIPHTRTTRILLDVAAWDPHLTSSVLEQMIVKRLITIQDAQAAVRRYSKQGRPGVRVLRATVDAWALRQRPPDSVLEARFATLRKEFGLPEFEFQRSVGRFRTDFCRVPERTIVECDGFKDHGARSAQIERDKERDAELTADGWVVMRFTWHQITQRSAWVASRIRRTLLQRRTQLGLGPDSSGTR